MMFQAAMLFPNRTVKQNIALPLELLGTSPTGEIDDVLSVVGLRDYADFLPHQLSGGMKTRVAMAMSFVTNPKLLMLDEPFGQLDLGWKQDLYASLADLKSRAGTTVLMVTHDLEEAVFNANRIIVLSAEGRPLDMLELTVPLPRPFAFADTVSRFTHELDHLAHLLAPRHGGPTSRQEGQR